MDFALTEEHKMIREMVRNFAEKEIRHIVSDFDEKGIFPRDLVSRAADLGLMGVTVPAEYGGVGLDTVSYCIVEEELARVWASFGLIISANNSLSCAPIFNHGTEEQKKKYLIPLAKGEKLGCYAQTEPNAGSDVSGISTKASFDEKAGQYVINGNKTFITNGDVAAICVLIARTSRKVVVNNKVHQGLSAFIVEGGTPGFLVGKHENKMGIRGSSTVELIFDNCRIPKENILGKEGDGFKIAMQTLNGGRINIAAQAVGIARGALEESLKYSKERKQFGQSLCEFQITQFKLAEMATRIEAARLLTWRAAQLKDSGADFAKEAAMAKLFASEAAVYVTGEAVQIHGGHGYIKEYPVERMFRDAKITQIYEGTSEIQKMVISRRLLK